MFSGGIEKEAWMVLIYSPLFSYNTNTIQSENDLIVNKVVNEYPYFFKSSPSLRYYLIQNC